MPVFNGERYLADAVESVLEQTLPDLELVVVDDGSSDSSREIVEAFALSDARVRLIVNDENLGVAPARNQAWREARAPFVAVLDSDDVALPDRLSRQVEFLDAHPSVAAVGGAVIAIDGSGRHGSLIRFPTSNSAIRSTLRRHNCLAHPTVLMRRSALVAVDGYRLDRAEDYDLWLRLSERWMLANLSEPVTLYRQHPGQMTVRTLEGQTLGRLAAMGAARERRAGRRDPLEGVAEVTPELLIRLHSNPDTVAGAVESDRLYWAAILASLGYRAASDEILARSPLGSGDRMAKAFAAAEELTRAESRLSAGQPVSAVRHVLVAVRREPRYTSVRLAAKLRHSIDKHR